VYRSRAKRVAAFPGLGDGEQFDAALLDQTTPELIFRPDMIASELLEPGQTNEAVRALRSALTSRRFYCGVW
jgi:hypothetical protein